MFTKSQMLQLAQVWMHTNVGFIRALRVSVRSCVSCKPLLQHPLYAGTGIWIVVKS